MDQSQMADIMEIEQMLARYSVGMSADDIESVMEVFSTDGWYSAFGDRYAIADFPRLVASAPKGLFMTGTAAIQLNGDTAEGSPNPVLHRPNEPQHAPRGLQGHLSPHRKWLAAGHPGSHVPAAQRHP